MIVKPQVVKSGEIPAPTLVNVGGSVGKIMKADTMVHQPQVIVSMGKKIETNSQPIIARVVSAGGRQLVDGILPKAGASFKIAGGQNVTGQSNLIQVSGSSNSQVAQYTVVAKGKNFISMGNQTKLISTQAHTSSSPSQGIVTSTGTVMISNSQSQSNTPMKIVQGGSITAQQLVGAKLINVQTLAKQGIKTTGGMK